MKRLTTTASTAWAVISPMVTGNCNDASFVRFRSNAERILRGGGGKACPRQLGWRLTGDELRWADGMVEVH